MIKLFMCIASLTLALGCGSVQRPDGGEGLLPVGAMVPELTRRDHAGAEVALRNGGVSVVYFYPRDGTPGCTREACAFRDAWERYRAAEVRVIGVSSDSDERHRAFAREHELPFSLVSDPDHTWSKAFGVSTVAGMDKRVSFLVDEAGKVAKVYEDVDPGVHANELLSDIAQLAVSEPKP